jgi:hypothetical protein
MPGHSAPCAAPDGRVSSTIIETVIDLIVRALGVPGGFVRHAGQLKGIIVE